MKHLIPFLAFAFLISSIGCKKDKTCIDASLITPCVAQTFPDSTANLGFTINGGSAVNFTVEYIREEALDLFNNTSDDCFIHETLNTNLKDNDGNYEITFFYAAQNFGRGFYIYFRDLVLDTEDRFSISLKDECLIEDFFIDDLIGEVFLDTLMIDGESYQNVYKLANEWEHDGVDFNDNNKFQFIYFSLENGIIKLESEDESWEKLN